VVVGETARICMMTLFMQSKAGLTASAVFDGYVCRQSVELRECLWTTSSFTMKRERARRLGEVTYYGEVRCEHAN
jgi:hypothetical protein